MRRKLRPTQVQNLQQYAAALEQVSLYAKRTAPLFAARRTAMTTIDKIDQQLAVEAKAMVQLLRKTVQNGGPDKLRARPQEKKRRRIAAVTRKRMAAAARARWAKVRSGNAPAPRKKTALSPTETIQ
jgi:hypothetical protein